MNTHPLIIISLALAIISTASAQNCIEDCGNSASLQGTYVVVDLRRSSFVSGSTEDTSATDWLGRHVVFDDDLKWIDGQSCDAWSTVLEDEPIVDVSDPNLSDLAISPVVSPASNEDVSGRNSWQLMCNESNVGSVFQLDSRVLVINSASGLTYAILEKPLRQDQIRKLQKQLIDMKFYEGLVNGELDESTQRAVAAYAEYRGAHFRFHRTAITENLLDGLGISSERGQ